MHRSNPRLTMLIGYIILSGACVTFSNNSCLFGENIFPYLSFKVHVVLCYGKYPYSLGEMFFKFISD